MAYEYMCTLKHFPQFLPHVKSGSCRLLLVCLHQYYMASRGCNDVSVGHGHQVLRITLIDEFLSQEKSERIVCVIT